MTIVKKYRRCHAGNFETSGRMKKTYLALHYMGDRGATTLQIQNFTGSMCVHSDVSALRANGVNIAPAKYIGTYSSGSKVYLYKLLEKIPLPKKCLKSKKRAVLPEK